LHTSAVIAVVVSYHDCSLDSSMDDYDSGCEMHEDSKGAYNVG